MLFVVAVYFNLFGLGDLFPADPKADNPNYREVCRERPGDPRFPGRDLEIICEYVRK